MSLQKEIPKKQQAALYGIKPCLKILFPDDSTAPGIRTFNSWRKRGYYPYLKINKRIFLCPVSVRKALIERFTTPAKEEE